MRPWRSFARCLTSTADGSRWPAGRTAPATAPAGTPPEIIARLNAEIIKILKGPKVRDTLLVLGGEPVGSTPGEFGAFFKNEVDKWGKVIREAKMQID